MALISFNSNYLFAFRLKNGLLCLFLFFKDEDPPPEPAPPEIPPRAQSLLATLTKKLSSYTLKTNETGDIKHEEFIPQNQQGKNSFTFAICTYDNK